MGEGVVPDRGRGAAGEGQVKMFIHDHCQRCGARAHSDKFSTWCINRYGHEFWSADEPAPEVERKSRLTIEVRPHYWARFVGQHVAFVHVDGYAFRTFTGTEPEARAAAQAYVDELIKHFQEGGR